MINLKKIFFFVLSLVFLVQGVFASKIAESFATLKTLFTDTIILDGFAIFFIFIGFYTLYFVLLQFFVKNTNSGERPRVVIAAMLSFFSGSTIIFALKDATNGIAVAAGSWLFLFLLIPGTLAVAFKYIVFIKKKQELGMSGKIFFGAAGLLAIDFLFTNFLIWASKNANVGGISANILETLLRWNQTIYDFLLFMFFIGLIGFVIYLITKGGIGGSSNKVSAEKKNRNEIKSVLSKIKSETKESEDILAELNSNLRNMGNLRGQ